MSKTKIAQDIKKIKKLAGKKGIPFVKVNYFGKKACSFVYGKTHQVAYWYPNITKGVQGELARLNR